MEVGVAPPHALSPRQLFWPRFRQDKAAVVGAAIIVVLIFLALFGGRSQSGSAGIPRTSRTGR